MTAPLVADTDEKLAICQELSLARKGFQESDTELRRLGAIRHARQRLVLALETLLRMLQDRRYDKADEARRELHEAREELRTLGVADLRRTGT